MDKIKKYYFTPMPIANLALGVFSHISEIVEKCY
jgi:hypothetical protein